jgi:hypothetical protein
MIYLKVTSPTLILRVAIISTSILSSESLFLNIVHESFSHLGVLFKSLIRAQQCLIILLVNLIRQRCQINLILVKAGGAPFGRSQPGRGRGRGPGLPAEASHALNTFQVYRQLHRTARSIDCSDSRAGGHVCPCPQTDLEYIGSQYKRTVGT